MKIEDINISDSRIRKISRNGDALMVQIENWQGQSHSFIFTEVVGFQAFSPEGQELSHALSDDGDSFIADACDAAQEDSSQGFNCYKFISPWTEKSILTIVSRSFTFR